MNELPQNHRGRKTQRRVLITLAALITLTAFFYLEEDWRGKRAWENCKREVEARGVVLNWDKYIPAPVPDDQNFFTASTNILYRFRSAGSDAEAKLAQQSRWLRIEYSSNSFPVFDNTKSSPLVVGVLVVSPGAASPVPGPNDLVVKLNDDGTPQKVQARIQKTIGRSVHGPANFEFSELDLNTIKPSRIFLKADAFSPLVELEKLIPQDLDTNLGHLQIQATGDSKVFNVLLTGVKATTAADYLKWSDQFEPALDEVREALKRPCAVLPGDYSEPYKLPIPNFVTMRSMEQMLSQRAQCDFLLNRPDEALRDLTLEHDVCRILGRPPVGRPITLVESMINVAIAGLYANTVRDGLQLHAWQDPQLTALEEQLKADDLLPLVVESLNSEQSSASCTMLKLPIDAIRKDLQGNDSKTYLYLNYGPRGWLYQNAVGHVERMQGEIQGFNSSEQLFVPKTFNDWSRKISALTYRSPYSFLDAIFLPNLTKAAQTTAYQQTMVNEAMVACALERYRLALGEYPETIDALVPKFIAELPHDVIGGQPLHYRRTDAGKFLLYSVGWNETDDGGRDVLSADGSGDRTTGDWVWKNQFRNPKLEIRSSKSEFLNWHKAQLHEP